VIKNDQLELVQVPVHVIVDGTVTSVDQLSHRRTMGGDPCRRAGPGGVAQERG
jgi:hypothetical protein